MPRYTYEHAVTLRGTLGERMPLSSIEDDGVAIMWKTVPEEPPRVWVGPVSGIGGFTSKDHTIVLMWFASYIAPPRAKVLIPRPGIHEFRPPPDDRGDQPPAPWDIADDEPMPRAPSETSDLST